MKRMYHLFTHNDLDGISCGILAKMAFGENISIDYCSNGNVDRKVKKYLENKIHEETNLFITDISVHRENEQLLQAHYEKGNSVIMLDHHQSALHFNDYPWGFVIEKTVDGKKTAATSLFYQHLVEQGFLKKTTFLNDYVELVRLYDTWEWSVNDVKKAKRLNDLFYILGHSVFEEEIIARSNQETFSFKPEELFILEMEENKIERYIQQKEHQMIQTWYKNFKVGVVFGEQFHSELGNELHKKHPYLDLIIILNAGANKVSFRTIHDHVNVSKFARIFGGGGHPKGATRCVA